MSVEHKSLLYVGKEFESQEEAKDFYFRFFDPSKEDLEYIEDNSFAEFIYGQSDVDGTILDHFNSYGYVLGIDISSAVRSPDMFVDTFSKAVSEWKRLFKNEPHDIVHTVCVY